MFKTLLKSVREYKLPSVLTPILVFIEVIIECIIPMVIAELVNRLESDAGMHIEDILIYGGIVVLLAILSLAFGALAGITCSTASCGFAKNLRRDMFYSIEEFKNLRCKFFLPTYLFFDSAGNGNQKKKKKVMKSKARILEF